MSPMALDSTVTDVSGPYPYTAEPPTAGAIRFLETKASQRPGGLRNKDRLIVDNYRGVQVQFLSCRCRSERLSLAVATDHHSSKPGSTVGTRTPTGNALEPS
jgi:hypothetical protein